MTSKANTNFSKITTLILLGYLLFKACTEFYEIAWGTGDWLGQYSPVWAVFYFSFLLFCLFLLVVTALIFWKPDSFQPLAARIILTREKLGFVRWILWFIILVIPVWLFQYTPAGVVFQKFHIRILLWVCMVLLLSSFISRRNQFLGWSELLASLIATSSLFSIVVSLKDISSYPFSLGWSEGNRLWDYSILFGRDRYIYPAGQEIPVLLDFGRRLIGGLPFLFPGTSITVARLWVGLTLIIPYLLLGMALFRANFSYKSTWILLVLWTFLFLKQGPIHSPLLITAALVALAWRAPLKYALPFLLAAGFLAANSRFTWAYAPGLWIVMLELASVSLTDARSPALPWKRILVMGLVGLFGGLALPVLVNMFVAAFFPAQSVAQSAATVTGTIQPAGFDSATSLGALLKVYLGHVIQMVKDQPLLWYRLLPNSTYNLGILVALLLAVTPLVIILLYLSHRRIWRLKKLQQVILFLPLFAFLVVGLIASTKIGGGGDLHNMDMFLIGLLFITALAWYAGGQAWLQDGARLPLPIKILVAAMLISSSLTPLQQMRPNNFSNDLVRLRVLTDADIHSTLEMLPPQVEVESALDLIQEQVEQAKVNGEILFIDQRQLLTFGYIQGVALVPEYEKKQLMNQAMSQNADYFKGLYSDLADRRFSLIISEPLRLPVKDSSYQFGEENNAWVTWVAAPILCYYQPLETIKSVNVQLLIPNPNPVSCPLQLP